MPNYACIHSLYCLYYCYEWRNCIFFLQGNFFTYMWVETFHGIAKFTITVQGFSQ